MEKYYKSLFCAILILAVKEILTVSETARFLQKHPDTIRRWIERKILPARKIAAGGKGVFVLLKHDVLEFAVSTVLKHKPRKEKEVKHFPSGQRKLL